MIRPGILAIALLILSGMSSFSFASTTIFYYYVMSDGRWEQSSAAVCPDIQLSYPNHSVVLRDVASNGYVTCDIKNPTTGQVALTGGRSRSSRACVNPEILDLVQKKCVPPPPPPSCTDKAGQTFNLSLICAQASCTTGWTSTPPTHYCDGTVAVTAAPVPGSVNEAGCKATFKRFLNDNLYTSPSSSGPVVDASCDIEYQFTGDDAGAQDPAPPPDSGNPSSGNTVPGAGNNNGSGNGNNNGPGTGDNGSGTGGGGSSSGPPGSGECTPEKAAAGLCSPTGTGSGGTGTGQGKECTQAQQDAGMCTGGSYGSSDSCETPPDCDGDPVQCGIILQSWRDICRLTRVTDEQREGLEQVITQEQGKYNQAKTGFDEQVDGFFTGFEAKISQSSGPTCFSDVTVPVMQGTITIPLSNPGVCEFFAFLRIMVLLAAYVEAMRIIFPALA